MDMNAAAMVVRGCLMAMVKRLHQHDAVDRVDLPVGIAAEINFGIRFEDGEVCRELQIGMRLEELVGRFVSFAEFELRLVLKQFSELVRCVKSVENALRTEDMLVPRGEKLARQRRV